MAINEIEVNTSLMSADTEKLRTTVAQIQTNLGGMFESVNELDQMWDGPANEAFNRQFRMDHDTCRDLCKILLNLIESIEHARNEYDKCEAAIHSLINSIHL